MPITERDRRTLIIGGCTLAGMLVLFLIYNLISGGGGGGTVALPPVPNPSVGGTPSLVPGSPSGPTTTPSVSIPPIENFSGRDPFSLPPALQSGTATSTGTATGTTTATATATPTGTNTQSGPPPTAPGGGSSKVVNGYTVVLLDTFTRNGVLHAQTEVDGTVYDKTVGETFSPGHFELRSIQGRCATYLNGDESFTLCATSSK